MTSAAESRPAQSVDDALRTLRSTRTYAPDPVGDDVIERWIDAARWCGSSKNTQPWRFIVVRDRALLDRLADAGHHSQQLRGAPVAIVVAMRRTAIPFSRAVDLGRVAQSLMLRAHQDGYGSCIAVLEPGALLDDVRTELGIDEISDEGPEEGLDVDLVLSFGRPAPEPDLPPGAVRVSPPGRLPVAALTSWERLGSGPGRANQEHEAGGRPADSR